MNALTSNLRQEGVEAAGLATEAVLKLLAYCRASNWAGYDPYDALNSRLFEAIPFLNFRMARLFLTQANKRCPVNLRPALFVPKTQNAKGLALFLSGILKLLKLGLICEKELVTQVSDALISLRSSNVSNWCWGYSFPWQTRTLLVPRGAPNLVCTTFVANALLDLHEVSLDARYLRMAVSAADYILDELYWTEGDEIACFSYPTPQSRSGVPNANFLGAALLCRVAKQAGERRFMEPALKVARYSTGQQHSDGSWEYGEAPTQRWIDNFHTGFNLCALRRIGQDTGSTEFEPNLVRGFDFYRKNFFCDDGAPKYFHDQVCPLDVHSLAQSIITLMELNSLAAEESVVLCRRVLRWGMANLWDDRGYFYYQKRRHGTNRIPYMRWGQAWMLLALAVIIEELSAVRSTAIVAQLCQAQSQLQ